MPQSLILKLVTQSAVPPKHRHGQSIQQLFFNLVDLVDSDLGRVLRHDKENRSYSLSPIQQTLTTSVTQRVNEERSGIRPPGTSTQSCSQSYNQSRNQSPELALQYPPLIALKAKTPCWWRVTFLDDALFDHLFPLWEQLQNEVFALGPANIKVVQVVSQLPDSFWAASCSYRDLYEQASAHQRDIHLTFVTPTVFESGGHTTALPTAQAVFHPLRKAWNRYSGLVFAPSLIDNIVPAHFHIQTKLVDCLLSQPSKAQPSPASLPYTAIGCVGFISFRVGGHGDPLITKRINALANFTQYCSIGFNTRFGMGVVKRIEALPSGIRQSYAN